MKMVNFLESAAHLKSHIYIMCQRLHSQMQVHVTYCTFPILHWMLTKLGGLVQTAKDYENNAIYVALIGQAWMALSFL